MFYNRGAKHFTFSYQLLEVRRINSKIYGQVSDIFKISDA